MPQPVIVKINSKIYNIPILKWLILKMHKFNKKHNSFNYNWALRERTCNQPPLWFYLFNVGTSRGDIFSSCLNWYRFIR